MPVSPSGGVSAALLQLPLYRSDNTPTPASLGELWMDTSGGTQTLKVSTSVSPVVWAAVATGTGAPTGASYLTLGLDGTLTAERVLTAGTNISFVDTGVNGTLTINASGGASPSYYGIAKWGVD